MNCNRIKGLLISTRCLRKLEEKKWGKNVALSTIQGYIEITLMKVMCRKCKGCRLSLPRLQYKIEPFSIYAFCFADLGKIHEYFMT